MIQKLITICIIISEVKPVTAGLKNYQHHHIIKDWCEVIYLTTQLHSASSTDNHLN